MKSDIRSGRRDQHNERRRSRSGSRSPVRSKVIAPSRGRERERRERSRSRSDQGGDKYDRKDKVRHNSDNRSGLRMDQQSRAFRDRDEHEYRDREIREDRNISLKRNSNSIFADLDRAVKKAREERNGNSMGYWNKKVIEVEEKDPNRWGHSGFKELYSRDADANRSATKKDRRSHTRSRSLSNSRNPAIKHNRNVERKSRSRSPMLKQLHKARQRDDATAKLKSLMPKGFVAPQKSGARQKTAGSTGKIRPLLSMASISPPKRLNTFRSRKSPVNYGHTRRSSLNRSTGRNTATRPRPRSGQPLRGGSHDRRVRSTDRRLSSSRSASDHSRTPSPQLRRPYGSKTDLKARTSKRSVSKSRSRSRRRSGSRSFSSSSVSSEDEDVLDLHPRNRRSRSHSISRSESTNSSISSGSSARRSAMRRRRDSQSSSSSSTGSDGDESDHSTAMAKDKDRSARNNQPSPVENAKAPAKSKSTHGTKPVQTGAKRISTGNKMLTPSEKAAAAAKGKPTTPTATKTLPLTKQQAPLPKKSLASNTQPTATVQKKDATVSPQKKTVVAGKPSVTPNKAPLLAKKPGAQAGKQPLPAAKQSVNPAKPSVPRKANLGTGVPSKQPASKPAGKQPAKASATGKQKVLSNSAVGKNSSDKTRKRIPGAGPSDIDSDSSAGDEIVEIGSKKGNGQRNTELKRTKSKRPEKPAGKSKPSPESKEEGESDSDSSESSTDSESEPRMTLSERFAKLTQMNTDKREFAKPVLSVNEIDTKLKVIKDLRGPTPDTKIYVEGQPQKNSWTEKSRPKSPEFAEGGKFPSDERRRHFERVSRDDPKDRPADWSDITVRFNFYRDRGCFDERPLTIEEYSKWEAWYYEYKAWLEQEQLYNQQMMQEQQQQQQHPARGPEFSIHSRLGSDWRPDRVNRSVRPSMASRLEQRVVRSQDNRPYFDERNNGHGNFRVNDRFARRIGHAPSGSLLVNIRQENNYGRHQALRGRGPRN